MMDLARKMQYKMAYDLFVRPRDGERSSGQVTLYFKPPRVRMDTDIRGQPDQASKTSVYLADDQLYLCAQRETQSCSKTSREKIQSWPFKAAAATLAGIEKPQEFSHVYLGMDLQARTPAHCWELTPKETGSKETVELCASTEGVPMTITYRDGDGNRVQLRAASVAVPVSDEDLKLPGE